MTNKFTASEVRRTAAAIEGKQMLVSSMLRAFADMLEAQERAVPVRQFRVIPGGLWCPDIKDDEIWNVVTRHPESYETRILYTHPSPADANWKNNVLAGDMKAIVDGDGNVLYVNKASFDQQVHKTDDALATVSALTADAERLAEALREFDGTFLKELADLACIPEDDRSRINRAFMMDCVVGLRRCWDKLSATRAHSAQAQSPAEKIHSCSFYCDRPECIKRQRDELVRRHVEGTELAQPPAASVTDATVNAAMLAYNIACHVLGVLNNAHADGMRAALKAALAAQENPNGL